MKNHLRKQQNTLGVLSHNILKVRLLKEILDAPGKINPSLEVLLIRQYPMQQIIL